MNATAKFPGRFILAADITLTSPMHISAIEKGRYVYENVSYPKLLRFDSGPGAGNQCTLTRTMRLGNHSYEIKTDDGSRTKFGVDVPIIPASTLGGMMRNAASELIFESLVARDLSISTDAYNTMCSGSATTSLSAGDATPEVIALARRDAFLANFGGTSFALSSRSVVSNGMPILQMTSDMLMTPPMVDPLGIDRLDEMTSAVAIVRKDSVADMRGKMLEDVVKLDDLAQYLSGKAEDAARASESKAKQKAAKEAGEAFQRDAKKDLRTLGAIEAVNAGLSFAIRIQVDAATPQQLGLMVLALQKILRAGQVGGKGARGFGQFVCEQTRIFEIDPATNRPLSQTGDHLFSDRSSGYAVAGIDEESSSSSLVACVEAARDYIENIEPDLIEAFAATDSKTLKRIYSGKTESAEAE